MIVPPQVPSVLIVRLEDDDDVEVFALVVDDGEAATQAAIGVPAERYQFATGSPRHVPMVTDVPYPSAAMALRMNSVRLYTVW